MLSGFAKVAETLPFLFPCLAYRLSLANKLSGVVAQHLSGSFCPVGGHYETNSSTAGDPDNAFRRDIQPLD